MLIVDSREKWTQGNGDNHIRRAFDKAGIDYVVRKLDEGDYMMEGGTVTVDRKQNLDELAANLLNKVDKARFWREARRAAQKGIKLIVLCEHGDGIESINDVPRWKSKYTQITGRSIITEMIRLEMAYGVRWCFCDRRNAGEWIIKLLGEGNGQAEIVHQT